MRLHYSQDYSKAIWLTTFSEEKLSMRIQKFSAREGGDSFISWLMARLTSSIRGVEVRDLHYHYSVSANRRTWHQHNIQLEVGVVPRPWKMIPQCLSTSVALMSWSSICGQILVGLSSIVLISLFQFSIWVEWFKQMDRPERRMCVSFPIRMTNFWTDYERTKLELQVRLSLRNW